MLLQKLIGQPGHSTFCVFILLDFGVGLTTGFYYVTAFYDDKDGSCCTNFHLRGVLIYAALEALGKLTSLASLLTSGASFGWPDMGPRHCVIQLVFSLWMLAITTACGPLVLVLWPSKYDLGLYCACLVSLISSLVGIRGWPLVVATPLMVVIGSVMPTFTWYKLALDLAVSAFTRYLHDQRLVVCIMAQPTIAYGFGVLVQRAVLGDAHWALAVASGVVGLWVPYVNLLLRRHRRYLPPGLQRVKFVRLGYLRRLWAEGGRIRRCQDLPEDAFGDPGKAVHLIILSHRWLDQHTCDVPTNAEPCGVKLEALLEELEQHFSPSRRSCFRGHASRRHAASCIGGWDVLVFFDFMSVPQEGVDDSGQVVPRTALELEVFQECLPHMGALYSLFPVLALTRVPEGDTNHEYFGSGWCLCEFSIAMLGQQLRQHSGQLLSARHSLASCSDSQMSADAAQEFRKRARSEFATMRFTHESDRTVAQDIVESFLAKRMLMDLTRSGNTQELERTLAQLPSKQQLRATLEQPVDAQLNTLLHVAVEARQPKAAELFLSRGARATARNLRGDTPAQYFALPRVGAAAAMCRSWREEAMSDDSMAEAPQAPLETDGASEFSEEFSI